jgi:quercetin dioxygenase-like cupin family protein
MNKFGKIWGFTSNIFINDAFSIDRIEINAEQSCSKHYHQYKYNMFFVEKGSILVHRWENNIQITSRLDAYESITIEPNIYHQFYALSDTIVYEIYYNKINANDIVRDNNESK